MNKTISVLLVLVSLLSMISISAFAASGAENDEMIYLEDGSYIVVTTEPSLARAANTVTGSKVYTCYGENNNVLWKATLTATFAYSGAWYTCTTANCNVAIYSSYWRVADKDTVGTGSCAITNLTMERVVSGKIQDTISCQIKLNCDSNGNIT